MNENLKKAQDIFLENINHICREFGLNNIMAQLYAILYFSNKPLSLDDMVERLKISKGSASVNIRVLERYGAARKVWIKGSRRDYYEAETNIAKVVLDRIKSMADRRLSSAENVINAAQRAIDSVGSKNKEDVEIFNKRLNKLRDLHRMAQYVYDVLNSGTFKNILGTKLKIKQK